MANSQDKAKEHQLANSYSSQKGEPERHLLNPLYHQNHQQTANSNPLPHASVVTPPSATADDLRPHEYASLDDFQPTVNQWPPQPQEYSNPTAIPPVAKETGYLSKPPHAYSEPVLQNSGEYKVGEDGIVTDQQGYAALDPTVHMYDQPQVNGAAAASKNGGGEGISTLFVPQPYETPLESSYEDASSVNVSRSNTPLNERRESPERKESPATEYTSQQGEENTTPYATPSPNLNPYQNLDDQPNSESQAAAPASHGYATLEPPK